MFRDKGEKSAVKEKDFRGMSTEGKNRVKFHPNNPHTVSEAHAF